LLVTLDIDECASDMNPCHNKSSCVPVSAPAVLGVAPTPSPNCSKCPEGTEDMDPANPGRICSEKNGCVPNRCSRPEQCRDVKESADDSPGCYDVTSCDIFVFSSLF